MLVRRYDLQLDRDPSGRFLPWVVGVMVFLGALALAGAMALNQSVLAWNRSVEGTLTVQVGDNLAPDAADRVTKAVAVLRSVAGIREARALSRTEVERLLEPWLGKGNIAADLPLPDLIDVRLAPGVRLDIKALTARLGEAVPGARIDDNRQWLARLITLARAMQGLAAGIVGLVVIATVTMVIFATRAGLAVHHEVIEVVHLIGARDAYIARQFQAHTLNLALGGGIPGFLAAMGVLITLGNLIEALQAPLLPRLALDPVGLAALIAVPVAAALLATWTARFTVLRRLRQMV